MGKHVITWLLMGYLSSAQAGFDPMRPPSAITPSAGFATPDAGNPRPVWIRIEGRKASAWLAGRVVVPGDQVNGMKVLSIHPDRVVVRHAQGRQVLRLVGTSIDKRATNSMLLTRNQK